MPGSIKCQPNIFCGGIPGISDGTGIMEVKVIDRPLMPFLLKYPLSPLHMTGIALTAEEFALVRDTGWILSKNRIMEKAMGLMGDLQSGMQELESLKKLPISISPAISREPKISRGENYMGLPYIILDYPRDFSKTSIFALRTLFLWGHYFSLTLHVAGQAREQLLPVLAQVARLRSEAGSWQICINKDPWQHHLEEGNYIPLSGLDSEKRSTIIQDLPFFKISLPLPLQLWEKMKDMAIREYDTLCSQLVL